MITSSRCYGVPDLLRVPNPSSCGWVIAAKGSAENILVFTLRFACTSFSVGPGLATCCNICNGAISEIPWALRKTKCFHFTLLTFLVSHPANMTAALVKPLQPSTAVTASLYTSSYILAASHQTHIYVKPRINQPSALNKI